MFYTVLPAGSSLGLILTTIDAAFANANLTPTIDGSAIRTISFNNITHTYSLSTSILQGSLYLSGNTVSTSAALASISNYKIVITSSATEQQVYIAFVPTSGIATLRAIGKRYSSINATLNASNATFLNYLISNNISKSTWTSLYTASGVINFDPIANLPIITINESDNTPANAANITAFETLYNCKVRTSETLQTIPRLISTVFQRPASVQVAAYSDTAPCYGWSTAFQTLIPRKYTHLFGNQLRDETSILLADFGQAGLTYGDTLTIDGKVYGCLCSGHIARID